MELLEFLNTNRIHSKNGVFYLSEPGPYLPQEKAFHELKEKEGHLYSDEELRSLPDLDPQHPWHRDWLKRKNILIRLEKYFLKKLKKIPPPIKILDLGSGNGWMANWMTTRLPSETWAFDINRQELETGSRLFHNNHNLKFFYGNIFKDPLPEDYFHFILMSGTTQYFYNLTPLFQRLMSLLKKGGEIHIIESPWYSKHAQHQAKKTSQIYYQQLGLPQMVSFYFYHTYRGIILPFHRLYHPQSFYNKIISFFQRRSSSAYPWLRLTKSNSS